MKVNIQWSHDQKQLSILAPEEISDSTPRKISLPRKYANREILPKVKITQEQERVFSLGDPIAVIVNKTDLYRWYQEALDIWLANRLE